jgi:hypothetical protein
MSVETGDRVTLAGKVVAVSNGQAQVRLDHDAYIVVPLEAGFHSIEKVPYRPKAGDWFTWGAGVVGCQCLWISAEFVLYTNGKQKNGRPALSRLDEMCKIRPCVDENGDVR